MGDNIVRGNFGVPSTDRPARSAGGPAGGGGGGFLLEQRIQGLEYEVGGLRRDISATRADLAELKGKVSMLPGYPGIAVIVTIIGGLLAIAQYLVGSGAAGP